MERWASYSTAIQSSGGPEASCSGRGRQEQYSYAQPGPGDTVGSFVLDVQLSSGATATVWEAVKLCDGNPTEHSRSALKVIKVTPCGERCVPDDDLQKEATLHWQFDHKNVASLRDFIADGQWRALEMELVNGVDFLEYVKRFPKGAPEELVVHYFRQLCEATKYMHSKRIAHRDIKPENCVIDLQTHTLKVVDFGLAEHIGTPVRPGSGTVYTIAPECIGHSILARKLDLEAVDIWGLGVTLYIALCGKYPFQVSNDADTLYNTAHGVMNPINSHVSPEARNLISHLLRQNPAERPKLDMILSHPFFDQPVNSQQAFALEASIIRLQPRRTVYTSCAMQSPSCESERSDETSAEIDLGGDIEPHFEHQMHQMLKTAVQRLQEQSAEDKVGDEEAQALYQEVVRITRTPSEEVQEVERIGEMWKNNEEGRKPLATWDSFPCLDNLPLSDSTDCCTPRGAKKLFTLTADARSPADSPSMRCNSWVEPLAAVPEVGERLELDDDLLTPSDLSARSEATVYDSRRESLEVHESHSTVPEEAFWVPGSVDVYGMPSAYPYSSRPACEWTAPPAINRSAKPELQKLRSFPTTPEAVVANMPWRPITERELTVTQCSFGLEKRRYSEDSYGGYSLPRRRAFAFN